MHKERQLVRSLLNWFSLNARDLPWRRTHDPYAIWVSEIMLQQTQVKTVIPYWERWMRELPTIEALANARPEKIHKLWEGLGYYTRVRNMQKAAQLILEKHDGKFPNRFDAVLDLPGIGRYTAGAICSIAFNQPTPILDGNVIRVLTRLFAIDGNVRDKETNAQLWELATELVTHAKDAKIAKAKTSLRPSRSLREAVSCSFLNQSLMELGALICTPREPRCHACPVSRLCTARLKDRVEELPNLGPRVTATARRFAAFVVQRDGKYLVRQRPEGVVNAHLWEFPNVELSVESDLKRAARLALGFHPQTIDPLCTIKHSITRYRIDLGAFLANGTIPPRSVNGQWRTLNELQSLSFPSAHRRILQRLT